MNLFLSRLLFVFLPIVNLFGMETEKLTISTLSSVSITESMSLFKSEADREAFKRVAKLVANPKLLQNPKIQKLFLNFDTKFLQKILEAHILPQGISILANSSSDARFLEIVSNSKRLLREKQVLNRFFSLDKSLIEKFISNPENAHLIDIIAEKSPDKIFKYLYKIGNKDFIESKYTIDRFKKLSKENSLIQSAKLPFIIIKDVSYEVILKIIEYFYGSQNVSSETGSYIRDIAQKARMGQDFKIKQINQAILDKNPEAKAFVVFNQLFLNEKYFLSLEDKSKRALIGHELGHIKENHSYKKLAYMGADIAITSASYSLLALHGKLFIDSKSRIEKLLTIGSYGSSLTAIFVLKDQLRSYIKKTLYEQEFEADKFAVQHLNNTNEFIDFLKSIGNESNQFINTETHPSIQLRIDALNNPNNSSSDSTKESFDTYMVTILPKDGSKNIFLPYTLDSSRLLGPCNFNPGFILSNPKALLDAIKVSGGIAGKVFGVTLLVGSKSGRALISEGAKAILPGWLGLTEGNQNRKLIDPKKLQDLYKLTREYREDFESGIFLKHPILTKFLICFKDQKLFSDLRLGFPLVESNIAQVVLHILDQNIRYHLNQATCFERTKTADFAYQMREYADIFGENLTTRKEYKELIRITDAFVQEKAGINFAAIVDLSKKTGISWKRLCDENLRSDQVKINKEIVSALSKGWLYLDDTKLFQESINESLDSLLSGNTEKARDILDVIKAKYVDVFRERTFFDPVYSAWGKIFRKPKNINAIDLPDNGSKTFELIKNGDEDTDSGLLYKKTPNNNNQLNQNSGNNPNKNPDKDPDKDSKRNSKKETDNSLKFQDQEKRTFTETNLLKDRQTILNSPSFKRVRGRTVKGAALYKKGNRYYHRDTQHKMSDSHLEVYDSKGRHIGEANPFTGELIENTRDKSKRINLK